MARSSSKRTPRRRARRRLRWLVVIGVLVGAVTAVRARALARDQQLFEQRYGRRST
ncbi:MAG: hypothetical protein ACXWCM_09865 [Acidimicrobiales bacterium]